MEWLVFIGSESQVKRALDRARQHKLPATLTLEEWRRTVRFFQARCAYCGSQNAKTLDHFIPLACGGGTTADNCVLSCHPCNLKKSDQLPYRSPIPHHILKQIERYLTGHLCHSDRQKGEKTPMDEGVAIEPPLYLQDDQELESGERLSILHTSTQCYLQLSQSGGADLAPRYQVAAPLTRTECLRVAALLLNAGLAMEERLSPPPPQSTSSWQRKTPLV